MINIFDVSGFLYAERKGTTVHGLNLTGLELLLYRIETAAGHCFLVLDRENKNRFDKSAVTDESGYKANRDGKPLEVGIMESFIETFLANEPGITVIRSEGEYESDDNIYTIAKDFGYFRKQEVVIHADDIDTCACIFDSNVEVVPITSHAPKRTFAEYTKLVDRGSYVPLWCVAHHIIEHGKKSDNIPPSNLLMGHTRRVDMLLSKWKRAGKFELSSMVKTASEYCTAIQIITEIYSGMKDVPKDKADAMFEEAMDRCEYVCCKYNEELEAGKTNIFASKRGVPFYTAYSVIGSERRPTHKYSLIDDTLRMEMENFLQQRGMDESEIEHYEGTKLPNESVDLSSFDFFDGEDEEFEDAIFFGDDEDVDAADISIGESNVFS